MTWRKGDSFVVHIRCDECHNPLRGFHEREAGMCDYCATVQRVRKEMLDAFEAESTSEGQSRS